LKEDGMTGKIIRIERVEPRDGIVEEPEFGARGYCLGDPKFGSEKHHAKNAVFVMSLDEAAELVSAGFSLRMVGKGKRASLVSPKGLRVVRG
jgi:predicted fused transcriptional regulator/phosphomethylpyrimidine kinase